MNTSPTNNPLAGRTITLLDGGMGPELIRRSRAEKPHPLWSLKVMLDEPQLVADVHRDFCRAGAKVICLNTYSVTRHRLTLGSDLPELATLLETAADLAEAGIKGSGLDDIEMVGCLPPLTASYLPQSPLDFGQMVAEYEELIRLQQARVVGFLAETIPSIAEAKAVLQAGLNVGVGIHLALTVSDEDGTRLRSGETLEKALESIVPLKPAAVLINCSTPEATHQAMPLLGNRGIVFGAYANGFHAVEALKPGGTVDVLSAREELDPETYAGWATKWLGNGASIVGGCCEVGPAHIATLAAKITAAGGSIGGLPR